MLYDAFGQVLLRGCAREACSEREMRPSVDLGMLLRSAVQLLFDLRTCEDVSGQYPQYLSPLGPA